MKRTPRLFVGMAFLLALVTPHAKAQLLSAHRIGDESIPGVNPEDAFGVSVAVLGDLDGPGGSALAIAVGARVDDDGGLNDPNDIEIDRGAVWILFLDDNGALIGNHKITEQSGGFTGDLDDGDTFGTAVAAVGDLDGDGVPDLAVGAPGDDDRPGSPPGPLGFDHGAVWILFLNGPNTPNAPLGTVKSHQKISLTEGNFPGPLPIDDFFGSALAPLGDLDGDGVCDLAVGSSGGDPPSGQSTPLRQGETWILFLNGPNDPNDPNSPAPGSVKSDPPPVLIKDGSGGLPPGTLENDDRFGSSITLIGDLDGDGNSDLAVGALTDDDTDPNDPNELIDQGAVYVLFLNGAPDHPSDPELGTVASFQTISQIAGGFQGDLTHRDLFGSAVVSLGDFDGPGPSDLTLAVGASGDVQDGFRTGAVWLLSLLENGTVLSHLQLTDSLGNLGANSALGASLAPLGDLNGDGIQDLVVGAPGDHASSAIWILLLDAPASQGTVNAGPGPVTDVLFVDGRAGAVSVPTNSDITVTMTTAPLGPSVANYALWAWAGPGKNPVELGGSGSSVLGFPVNPLPIHLFSSPQPIRCLHSQADPVLEILCFGVRRVRGASTAPFSLTKAGGLGKPSEIILQGILEDNGSASGDRFSVTNAVTLSIEPK